MTAAFDVRSLTAQQIADLLNNGHDLRQFKNALVPLAATLPSITDSKERQRRLDSLAHDVLKEWDEYRKSLPKFALDALITTTDLTWPGLTSSSVLLQPHIWPTGAALGVGILTYKGTKIIADYREHSSGPYRYLSNIAKVAKRRQTTLSIAPPR